MRRALKDFEPLALALVGVFVSLSAFYVADHRFFFLDDRQVQYFPYGLVIRDALLHGQFPFLTVRTFYGGALWLDPQYGLYNPLTLALNFLIDPQALQYSGFLMSLVLNLLLTVAIYSLGRVYGLKRDWAALLGLMMGVNIFILFFNSDTWHPALVCLIWSTFAWTSLKNLLAAERNISGRVLLSGLLIFQTVSAGWPHQYVALGAVMGVMFVETALRDPRRSLRLVYAGALGAVFSLPVLVPMLAASSFWSRPSSFFNNGVATPDVGDMLNFSNPLWLPRYQQYYMHLLPVPIFFLGWFALPLMQMADWRKILAGDRRRNAGLLGMTGIFTLLALSAQNLGPLRWPVRWLVDVHLAGLLLLLLAVQDCGLKTPLPRPAVALGALALTTLAAFFENPAGVTQVLWLVLPPALFICFLPAAARAVRLPAFLGATSVAMIMAMASCYTSTSLFLDHGVADEVVGAASAPDDGSRGYALYWGLKKNVGDIERQRDFMVGGLGGYYNINTINGYTSIFYRGLQSILPGVTEFADFTSRNKPQLATREPETGAMFADLLKISKIVVEKEAEPEGLPSALWQRHESAETYLFEHREAGHRAFDHEPIVTLERRQGFHLPGTVSWNAPDVTVGAGRSEGNGETLEVATGSKGGAIVFARLYYPGFRAALDGAPLVVRPLDKMLVAVDVPANAKGTLQLSFRPPLLGGCLALIALALAVWTAFAARERFAVAKKY